MEADLAGHDDRCEQASDDQDAFKKISRDLLIDVNSIRLVNVRVELTAVSI